MRFTRGLFLYPVSFAVANAFTDFNEEPTCVPDPDNISHATEELLPHICQFDAEAENWGQETCLDLPEDCTSVEQKLTWAFSKIYANGQAGCTGMGQVLSRKVKHPECVFGEPVPEMRVGYLFDVMYEAREAAEAIFSANPTYCAARLASSIYDIWGRIYQMRMSKVAMHGLEINPELKLEELKEKWNPETNDCAEGANESNSFPTPENKERLAAQEWKYSRKVFDTEECKVIRHFNGDPFAKPHDGGFEGCQIECMDEPECTGFNMDLRFHITIKQHSCDLLSCPPNASMSTKFGFVSFEMEKSKGDRQNKRRNKTGGGLRKFGVLGRL